MNQIGLIQQRLADAGSLPAVLAASWEIFELIAASASASPGESPEIYPAFTFARSSAVSGRNAVAFAPSMPVLLGQRGARSTEARSGRVRDRRHSRRPGFGPERAPAGIGRACC